MRARKIARHARGRPAGIVIQPHSPQMADGISAVTNVKGLADHKKSHVAHRALSAVNTASATSAARKTGTKLRNRLAVPDLHGVSLAATAHRAESAAPPVKNIVRAVLDKIQIPVLPANPGQKDARQRGSVASAIVRRAVQTVRNDARHAQALVMNANPVGTSRPGVRMPLNTNWNPVTRSDPNPARLNVVMLKA